MPTIALFGATGGTGRHILKLALQEGYKVQALVRNPSKLEGAIASKHEKLVVVEGDFSNEDAIRQTVTSANFVICAAGGKAGQKSNVEMMTNFVKTLWPILEETKPKTFVYQSDAFSSNEKGNLPFTVKMLRYSLGYCVFGLKYIILANESVTEFMAKNPPKNFKFIVTRPAALEEGKEGEQQESIDSNSKVELEASLNHTEFASISYKSMAAFTLQIMTDESFAGKCPFVNIKK